MGGGTMELMELQEQIETIKKCMRVLPCHHILFVWSGEAFECFK